SPSHPVVPPLSPSILSFLLTALLSRRSTSLPSCPVVPPLSPSHPVVPALSPPVPSFRLSPLPMPPFRLSPLLSRRSSLPCS
ncbi:unnamed protein product, partial [Closterium sp. Naga37s-1]